LQILPIPNVRFSHQKTNHSLICLLRSFATNQYGCFHLLNLRRSFSYIMRLFAFNNLPDSMTVICLPWLNTPGSDYKHLVKKYKCIHTYPSGTYLFSRFIHDSPFERINIRTSCPYDLFLADKIISERQNKSLHAKELNAIHESTIYNETLNMMLRSNDEVDENTSESDEEPLQLKPINLVL
jgi:hypothetical protein